MSLYDIIDEISQKQAAKTETGDTRVYGVMVGLVAKNYDQNMPGRVCVTVPTRDDGANELKWARVAMSSSGSKWGHYFLPEVGDQVLLAFEGGNIERPYVIGCIPKDNNSFLAGSVNEQNEIKRIVTKHGSTISFEDNRNDETGARDKITIQTADKRHTVLMDNENEKIRIQDRDGKNFIELSTRENSGALSITVESRITIKVKDTITITLNGETGMAKLEAQQVSVEASKMLKMCTDGTLSLKGANVTEEASSMNKIDSGGAVNIGGSIVKVGS